MNKIFPIVPASAKAGWTMAILSLLMLGLFLLSLYIIYSIYNVTFAISETELHIRGDIYGRHIPLTSLVTSEARPLDLNQEVEYQPRWRTNGVGLPGYLSGWFRLKNREKALLFVTDRRRVVYVPTTEGFSVMMSVREPENFLRSLEEAGNL